MIGTQRKPSGAFEHLLLGGVLLIFLGACLAISQIEQPTQEPVQEPQITLTEVARDLIARFTIQAGETAIAQLTRLAEQPTPTPQPASPTPLPPTATASLLPPTPVDIVLSPTPAPPQPGVPCDQARFIEHVTIPQDTVFFPGARFVKTWRVLNTGSCTWNTQYALAFSGGTPLSVVSTIFLTRSVPPGDMVDLSVPMNAPNVVGFFQSLWTLRNASGQPFGPGADGTPALEVRLYVVQSAGQPPLPGNFLYDFSANYCSANWQSGAGAISCPSASQDLRGSVQRFNGIDLESRRTNDYGLWVRPNFQLNGWARGQYPAYAVQFNDHFLAEVGCLGNSPGCDLIFQLEYQIVGGTTGVLGAWRETYDGLTTVINQDLSSLAGRNVWFTLGVTNNGVPENANAFWLLPRIQKESTPSSLALDWTRRGFPQASSCHTLKVFLTGSSQVEARAYSCAQGERELGRSVLGQVDADQFIEWFRRLGSFESETYQAGGNRPTIYWFQFRGQGASDASDADIKAINNWAALIFDVISKELE